jgi:DNA invertase Pin-like site-specific DNA recombinase
MGFSAMATTYAYLRVSTIDQDIEKNRYEILDLANNLGCAPVQWIEEKASGKVHWRKRAIGGLIDQMASGDTLIVSELSRLGRSMLECMEILSICIQRGIRVYAVKGAWRLDDTIQSKIVAMAFAMASEIERDMISSRTKEALAAKKRQGAKLGRPTGPGKSKLDQYRPEIEALLANGSSKAFIARRYGTSPANLYRWLNRQGIKPN